MNALNSWSFPSNHTNPDYNRLQEEYFERVFETKGLFIIPYDLSRVIASVKMQFTVLDTDNETRSLWTNPEIGFYGYAHARNRKIAYGSPIQLNQRVQDFFHWHPAEQYSQIEIIGTVVNLGRFLGSVYQFGEWFFPGPSVSDFSFGFQRRGRYRVNCAIAYWHPSTWTDLGLPRPSQFVTSPTNLPYLDPTNARNQNQPDAPLSPPYDPSTNDFGESDGAPPEPPDPDLPLSPFRFEWIASYPGSSPGANLSFPYEGPQITGYNSEPVRLSNGSYALEVTNVDGNTVQVPLGVGPFVTQEQEDGFLATFAILGLIQQ